MSATNDTQNAGSPEGKPTGAISTLLVDILTRLQTTEGRASVETAADAGATGQSTEDAAKNKDTGPQASLGALVDALDQRAFGLILLLLALPCCLPFLYGVPQVVALPMLFLAGQLALGRQDPWLPQRLRARRFGIQPMISAVHRASKYLGWIERFAHPRLSWLSEGRAVQLVGALMLIPTASILVPAPLTNTTPGIGVAITSVGLIERDGVLILLGLLIGLAWVCVLLGFVLVFGTEGAIMMKNAIKAMFGMS